MLNLVRKYALRVIGSVAFSTLAVFGIEDAALHRVVNPAQPIPLWFFIGIILLISALILLYMNIGDRRAGCSAN